MVALREKDKLLSQWKVSEKILLDDVASGNTKRIKYGLFAFISLGRAESINHLIEILNDQNNKDIAEAYLNCGHPTLEQAAIEWSKRNGYGISKSGGSTAVHWGGM